MPPKPEAPGERSSDGEVHPPSTLDETAPGKPTLPPRVLVELPDGAMLLGEDDVRLEDELAEAARQRTALEVHAAQPGSERWLELRRLLYATQLHRLTTSRTRKTLVVLGVDFVYMLMNLLAYAFQGSQPAYNVYTIVTFILNISGAALDVCSAIAALRRSVLFLRITTALHVGHFVVSCTSDDLFKIIVIVRVIIVLFMLQVTAAIAELKWVSSGLPFRDCGFWGRMHRAFLGSAFSGLRAEYISALAGGTDAGVPEAARAEGSPTLGGRRSRQAARSARRAAAWGQRAAAAGGSGRWEQDRRGGAGAGDEGRSAHAAAPAGASAGAGSPAVAEAS